MVWKCNKAPFVEKWPVVGEEFDEPICVKPEVKPGSRDAVQRDMDGWSQRYIKTKYDQNRTPKPNVHVYLLLWKKLNE